MAYNWAALFGQFKTNRGNIIFKGSSQSVPGSTGNVITTGTVANLLCDQYFEEGKISAEVEFKQIDLSTACQIIINYEQNRFICAGLSNTLMYEIREFNANGWEPFVIRGDRSNLQANKKYLLSVSLKGSFISLNINGVDLLSHNLDRPLRKTQVGIWCQSNSDIFIRNYLIDKEKPKIFTIMPFKEPYESLYKTVIKKSGSNYGALIIKASESSTTGLIIGDIMKSIYESKILIAEISEKNPNVYYEVGAAHTLNKPVILIAKKGTKIPFDVSPFRVLFYEMTRSGRKKLREGLNKHLDQILS